MIEKITRHCPHIPLPLDFSNCFFIYKKFCYLACAHYNFPTFLGIWNLKVWFFFAFLLCSSMYRNRGKNHFQKNSDQKFASFYKTRKEPALKIDILSNILRLWIIHFHFCNSQFDWTRTIFRRQIFNHVHLWYIPDRQWERTLFSEIVALRFLQRHHLFLFLF